MAAALNVTEPCSTGIGGDAFCLFYDATTKQVKTLLGNGQSPAALTHDLLEDRGFRAGIPPMDALNVTVPGAAGAWCDIAELFGTMTMKEVLKPATDLARNGFPVSPITSSVWNASAWQLRESETFGEDLLLPPSVEGGTHRAPMAGEMFRNPNLAKVFDTLAQEGKAGFYSGWIAENIVSAIGSRGGVMSLEDLRTHASDIQDPIMTTYRGIEIYEVPPPTQGIVALMALNLMEEKAVFNGAESYNHQTKNILAGRKISADRLHLDVECVRCAFAEAVKHVGDPRQFKDASDEKLSRHWHNVRNLASKKFARFKSSCISDSRAAELSELNGSEAAKDALGASHDTVYFCAVDQWGNGCSMINSNYMSFGTGIVPKGCGFSLQNRGHGFASLNIGSDHPNCIGPSKRPYHTIIPGLATYPGRESLYGTFGVMGGFMQPQGHAQVIRNMLDLGMDPQQALDAPRFFVNVADYSIGENIFDAELSKPKIFLESPISEEIAEDLRGRGHTVVSQVDGMRRSMFGRGQIIRRDPKSGVLTAGSDPRADGCSMAF